MKDQIFMALNRTELWLAKTANEVANKCNERVAKRMEELMSKYGVVEIIQP